MKDIIVWLRKLEDLAGDLYTAASEHFSSDAEFSAFLSNLAREEAWHFHLMNSAMHLFVNAEDFPLPAIKIDDEMKQRVEKPLHSCRQQLETAGIARGEFLRCLAQTEFSEWNDLVLYVIRICQKRHKAFQKIASAIQGHKKHIEAFLQKIPDGQEPLMEMQKLPKVWDSRYLVIDDEPATVELLSLLLQKDGEVISAPNGKEALDLIATNFFDVIISDVNMPVMTGIELFELATKLDESLGKRFILTTGNVTQKVSQFCRQHHLNLLPKPYSLFELKQLIAKITEKNARP